MLYFFSGESFLFDTVIVRFGELTLKSDRIRRKFRDILKRNIFQFLEDLEFQIREERGRFFVDTESIEDVSSRLSKIFGIVSVSPAAKIRADLEIIADFCVKMAKIHNISGKSFAVRVVKRIGKHDFSSMDLANIVGERILDAVTKVRVDLGNIVWLLVYHFSILVSCWLLYQARRLESSPLNRRHMEYIIISFIVFSAAYVKVLLTYGFDIPFILPLGIILVDSFGAVIGTAIMKDQLFDITVLVQKGVIYSMLSALIFFIFDFTQHLAATFFEELVGEHFGLTHYIPIAVVIIVFMPLKQRLEHLIGVIFGKKKIAF